jgi:hypothetical protein
MICDPKWRRPFETQENPPFRLSFRTATHWRMRAEAIGMLAQEANDLTVLAMMLRIAADYDKLARNADDRAA